MQLSNYLTKKLHLEKSGFLVVKHGQRRVTAATASPDPGSNQPVPIPFFFLIYLFIFYFPNYILIH